MDVSVASPIEAPDAVVAVYEQHDKAGTVVLRSCALMLSSFRLVLGVAGAAEALSVPLMSIRQWKAAVETGPVRDAFRSAKQRAAESAGLPASHAAVQSLFVVTIFTKHVWTHSFAFSSANTMLLRSIKHHLSACGRTTHISQLPAFAICAAAAEGAKKEKEEDRSLLSAVDFGWCLYDSEREFSRQLCVDPSQPPPTPIEGSVGVGVGVDLRPWFRLDTLDGGSGPTAYSRSPTYPTAVLVPKMVDHSVVITATAARSHARVPAITYVYLATGAVLARASQPLSGSSHLGADAALCMALVNVGYPVERAVLSTAARVAAPPPPPSATAAAPSPSPATFDTAASAPPSLFDEDSDTHTSPHTATAAATAATAATAALPLSPQQQQRQPSAKAATTATLMVADCRPWVSAAANATFGGGYESGPLYEPFSVTRFFEIDNVFGIAKAFDKLRSLLVRYEAEDTKYTNFWRDLEESEWFRHIQRVLVCSVAVASSLRRGVSVLVHCTDGWDRTSQCCATAAMLLDPFYRTAVGFCTLLQKDFCSFGHKFAERSEHQVGGRTAFEVDSGVTRSDTERGARRGGGSGGGGASGPKLQPSPIFVQYMDIVYQVLQQFPHAFEFTPELLAFLSEAVFSCLWGTFLCNSEQERRLEGVEMRTNSVWTLVLRQIQKEKRGEAPLRFLNDRYDAQTAWSALRNPTAEAMKAQVLRPNTSPKRMRFWSELYCKWDVSELAEGGDSGEDDPSARGFHGPPRKPRPQRRHISWGADFDAFLQKHIDDACTRRVADEEHLKALEAQFAKGVEPGGGNSRRLSEWCVFDPNVCYECLKAVSRFSAMVACRGCGHDFCSSCVFTHPCSAIGVGSDGR